MNVEEISKKYNISPIVCELLSSRKIESEDELKKFLKPDDSCFHDPFKLKNMDKLVKRIRQAMSKKEKVLIFGDYDVDGVSATAILVKYFMSKDFYVDYYLPNRYIDGYGLTIDTVKMIKERFSPDLIITVDCGISCAKEIDFARTLGIEIAVTDHHDIPEVIPSGIVVNAKLDGQEYPFKYLCGTGLAFKIVQALEGLSVAKEYLGIASIATIADIVPLLDENRAIVKIGMRDYENNLPLGVKMLFEQNKLPMDASSTDIAFRLAPKINAAGRMGDASVALNLYIKTDKILLKNTIDKLEEMNVERQALCSKVYDDAISRLENINISNYNAIVFSSPNWDSGILGIVSAKLANEFNRPTVLFSEVDGLLKGSARSVADIDIYSAISSQKEVLETFGGHKMAAGLTIKKSNFNNFLTNLNAYLSQNYSPKDFVLPKNYDRELELSQIDLKLVDDLEILEPCGCENPKPVFDILLPESTLISTMPKHPTHITMNAENLSIIAFNSYKYLSLLRTTQNRHIQIELQENSFKGKRSVKGIAKGILTGEIVKAQDGDLLRGIYLKQLFFRENKYKATLYFKKNLENFVKQAKEDYFGWLFVCSTFESYNNFCKMLDYKMAHYMFEIISNSGLNAVVLSPNSFKNFGSYKNIIFVDAILDKGYLSEVGKHTNARLFVPRDVRADMKIAEGLKFDRQTFAECFRELSVFSSRQLNFNNDYELYKQLFVNKGTKQKTIPFKQFVFCLSVFIDLGIFEIVGDFDSFVLKENKKIFKSLDSSAIYKKVEFVQKTSQK